MRTSLCRHGGADQRGGAAGGERVVAVAVGAREGGRAERVPEADQRDAEEDGRRGELEGVRAEPRDAGGHDWRGEEVV